MWQSPNKICNASWSGKFYQTRHLSTFPRQCQTDNLEIIFLFHIFGFTTTSFSLFLALLEEPVPRWPGPKKGTHAVQNMKPASAARWRTASSDWFLPETQLCCSWKVSFWSGSCGLPRQIGATLQSLFFFLFLNECLFLSRVWYHGAGRKTRSSPAGVSRD